MSNKIESTTPSKKEFYKIEIDKLYKQIKDLYQDIKTAQEVYFGAMKQNARLSLNVCEGLVSRTDYKKDYATLVNHFKELWSLLVKLELLQRELDVLKEERSQYYEQLGKQSN